VNVLLWGMRRKKGNGGMGEEGCGGLWRR